jgi:hypothetical protein
MTRALLLLLAPGAAGLAGCGAHSTPAPPRPALAAVAAAFEDRTAAAGITFRQGHPGPGPLPVLELMGTGCALLDADGDRRLDIFLIGQEGTGNTGRCALYRNQGNGAFSDVTAMSGLDSPGKYMGCAVGDINNDGRPDLVLTGYGLVRLFVGTGDCRFRDVTASSGLAQFGPEEWFTSAAFADLDGDGRVDLYLARYVIFNERTLQFCDYGGVKAACGPKFYDPQFGSLFRNLGDARFREVTREWGLTDQHGKCLGVVAADWNDDGRTDLYLGNDEMPGDLYINSGGRLVNRGLSAGVAVSGDGQMQGAMGVDAADYDGDGRLDLFVTTFELEPSSLYANRSRPGTLLFEHVSTQVGLDLPSRGLVGFGTRFADFDNDGYPDLAVANGHIHDNQSEVDRMTTYPQPLQLFMNQAGESFLDRSREAGPGFTTPAVGRGLATGDLDDDGRLDLLVTDLEGPPRLLYNRMPETGNWLRVRLIGSRSNRDGTGARVTVVGDTRRWVAQAIGGGSYLSASDPRLHFGLGAVDTVRHVEVRWPSGTVTRVNAPRVGAELVVREDP